MPKKTCILPPECGETVSKKDCDALREVLFSGLFVVPVRPTRAGQGTDPAKELLEDAKVEGCAFAAAIAVDEKGGTVRSTLRTWDVATGASRERVTSTPAGPYAVSCIGRYWLSRVSLLLTKGERDSPWFETIEGCVASETQREEEDRERRVRWKMFLLSPRAGLTLSQSSADGYGSTRPGFSGGVAAKLWLWLSFLESDVVYCVKSVQANERPVKLHYLDVPVLFKVVVPVGLHAPRILPEVYGGGQVSFRLFSEIENTDVVYVGWVWGFDIMVMTAEAGAGKHVKSVFLDWRFNGGSTTIGGRGVFLKAMTISVGYDF
ncbi:MAG: hypothetical protein HY897_07445 [Deltaproteobacteria bacterium]|nr:hypothetical protein [Deltaproteobacteria bacterium]